MATEDLVHRARELLSMTGGSASRSLNQLVGLVSRQVPGCSGATSAVWREHRAGGPGGQPSRPAPSSSNCSWPPARRPGWTPWPAWTPRPARTAPRAGTGTVSCPDTLEEERWPGFAAAALARGVRCCVTLAQRSGERALTLTMFGARPRSLDADQLPLAELLVAFGGAVMGNAVAYDGVQRTVLRLRDSVESGSLLDQARGVLMNARGCSAEEAWQQMRAMSAAQHITMTEVAQQVIASQGENAPEAGAG